MAYNERSNNRSAVSRIFDTATKVQEAKNKMKNELVKQAILKKMQSSQGMSDFKAKEDYKQKMKANDPGQVFLRNRMTQENPIDEMVLPEKPGDEVVFPADKVSQTPQGKLTTKAMGKPEQNSVFLAKLDRMMELARAGKGKEPSQYAQNIGAKMRENMPKSAGYAKTPKAKEQSINDSTKKILKDLSESVSSGKVRTQQDALDILNIHEDALKLQGVDMEYVKSQVQQTLPTEYEPGVKKTLRPKWLGGRDAKPERKKSGGKWYEKKDNYWEPAEVQKDDETEEQ